MAKVYRQVPWTTRQVSQSFTGTGLERARPAAIRGATVEVVSGMDNFDGLLATARSAYARGDWHAAYQQLSQAGLVDRPSDAA